ncbi:sel1 repeat family protein [Desulfovibrio sp. OttesenSCG-928-C14]|nr:sel1 repeat family protein [Desulfovibrio sp. OttesenSCG-928-C14]
MGFWKKLFWGEDSRQKSGAKDYNPDSMHQLNQRISCARKDESSAKIVKLMLTAIALDDEGKDEESFYWYKQAASLGNSDAQFVVGVRYQVGRGVRKSEEDAFEWYRKAAIQGHVEAQFSLGIMYLDAQPVMQICKINLIERQNIGVTYLKKASGQGHSMALTFLTQLGYI